MGSYEADSVTGTGNPEAPRTEADAAAADRALDPARVAELLQRQDDLQAEAGQVSADLRLDVVLGQVGRVVPIGSAASGLMVWRDLDLSIYCTGAEPGRDVATALRDLLADPRLLEAEYRNEVGPRSPSGGTHDQRYYAVLHYLGAGDQEWKIDLSFWTDAGPRGEFIDAGRLRERLTDETRLAVLWIKDVWHRLDCYPYEVGGMEVYDAVLNHGVRTPAEFATFLAGGSA
ncbi:hypothetical protein ABN028_09400 [Actinopolymorpha sp. B17G11]|uniref:hypothetical protein n=1 Tax=unclassified Actinopolymorpha TaxID=2627063 RepID=UPI0032D9646A